LSHAERDGATCSCNFRLPLSLIGVKFRAAWKFCSTGADLIFIGGGANVRAFYMMAFSEIKNVPDLKRKTGGVTRVGSSTDFALRYLVQKNGIKFLPGCPWQKDTPSRS